MHQKVMLLMHKGAFRIYSLILLGGGGGNGRVEGGRDVKFIREWERGQNTHG